MANIINTVQKPTLVLAHNKTLAGQLYSEFKEFFPENRVEYFVSFYDYYQPEAYIAQSDTYIEKDSSINDEIDKLRHSATASLFETRDVIIVASVSCIYGLGDPIDYEHMIVSLRPGMKKERNRMKKAQSRKREPFRIYRASITVEAALLYPILIFLLMFLLQKTITYYQQTDQAAQGIISVEEPDTSKMFWKIVLAQRVTEEIKEKAGLQEDNVYEN